VVELLVFTPCPQAALFLSIPLIATTSLRFGSLSLWQTKQSGKIENIFINMLTSRIGAQWLVILILTMAASTTKLESGTCPVATASGCGVAPPDQARYDNYRIYNVEFENEEQIELFQKLEEQSDSLTFIGHAREIGQKLSILVAAHRVADIADLLKPTKLSTGFW